MFSCERPSACTVFFSQLVLSSVIMCAPCVREYLREISATHRPRIHYGRQPWTCCCCFSTAPSLTAQSWAVWQSVRISCRMNVKKTIKQESAESTPDSLSFLRLLDPSPFSENLRGDMTIMVEGSEPIQVHRFVLAGKSPVFRTILEDSREVRLRDFHACVVRAAVNSMYTAELAFSEKVTPELMLEFASKYEISWIKEACEVELAKSISAENISSILSIAFRYDVSNLSKAAMAFLAADTDVLKHLLGNIVVH